MIMRQEHPNPQFERATWENLNGMWEFQTDYSVSGEARGMFKAEAEYTEQINVPFCVESKLSGIGRTDFINSVWYRKHITFTEENLNGRVLLHFGAVDYETTVYVNEKQVGTHKGGYVSFEFDITEYLIAGENTVVVNAKDDTRNRLIPRGKQSDTYNSHGCLYTRTTGIWQTVWLEFVPENYIKSVKYITDSDNGVLTVTAELVGAGSLNIEALFEGKPVGKASAESKGGVITVSVPLSEIHLWQVGDGKLYDLMLTYGEDTVKSYFGLRTVAISGNKVLINGKSVFQRLVLDQGFYPDGIYTAPSDADLIGDIERSLACGFNGARLHEKVFEQRFLYHCDRLGYIVWGEYPNWGLDHSYADSIYGILPEWLEEIKRDFNHPAIVTWCPFNETWDCGGRKQWDNVLRTVYLATKAADSTRPCVDTSGNFHVQTDIYDLHDYSQDPEKFKAHYEPLTETHDLAADFVGAFHKRQKYDGKMPLAVSEYGGIAWASENGWGYGEAPKSEDELIERFRGLTNALLDNENIYSFCYTQLTDVEQEQNGLYYYDRRPKFDTEIIKKITSRKAAIED